jgi:hypothetical protein
LTSSSVSSKEHSDSSLGRFDETVSADIYG